MSQDDTPAAFELTEWLAESLRLTAFWVPGPPLNLLELFQEIVEQDPEKIDLQPKLGRQTATWDLDFGNLILAILPGRLDWVLRPKPLPDAAGLLSLGPFLGAMDRFSPVVERWLERATGLGRLAFGAVLLKPVETQKEICEILSGCLLHIRLDPAINSEFFYQINYRRPSETADCTVNRLMKWSGMVAKSAQFTVTPGGPSVISEEGEDLAVRLEVDINTTWDSGAVLDRDRLLPLWRELVELGREIATHGERP